MATPPESDEVYALHIDSQGRILIAGAETEVRADPFPYPGFYMAANVNFAVVRLTASGALDSTFGRGGKLTLDPGGLDDRAMFVTTRQDGQILVGGNCFKYVAGDVSGGHTMHCMAQLNDDGTPDMSFGKARRKPMR